MCHASGSRFQHAKDTRPLRANFLRRVFAGSGLKGHNHRDVDVEHRPQRGVDLTVPAKFHGAPAVPEKAREVSA